MSEKRELADYIRRFDSILKVAKNYPYLFDNKIVEDLTILRYRHSPYNHTTFSILRENGELILRGTGTYCGQVKDGVYREEVKDDVKRLAEIAKDSNIPPDDLIRFFCKSIAKPLAEYNAKRESESLESQLLYQLEMNNQ